MNEPSEKIQIDISIVIPLKNEEESIPVLAAEVTKAFTAQPWSWECVWVNDGSTDESQKALTEVATATPQHRIIQFEENAGQSAAFCAGFKASRGSIISTIDADGQNDPADLPKLIHKIFDEDWDMVNGYREKRQDNAIRKIASRIGNGVRNAMTGRTVRDVGCSTRAFKRECVEYLPRFKGMHRFLPTLVTMWGFKITEVPVNHRNRNSGISKYTTWNRMWVGLADVCGVLWLRKRAFHFSTKEKG